MRERRPPIDDPRLTRLGWDDFFRDQIANAPSATVARVVEEQRGAYRVAGQFEGWSEVSGRYRHDASDSADFPAVGDWVCLAVPAASGRALVLVTPFDPEQSYIVRKVVGDHEDIGGVGVQMPFLGRRLCPDDIATLCFWAAAGALDDP